MRKLICIAIVLIGAVLTFADGLASALSRTWATQVYRDQLASLPAQPVYSRSECTAAAWRAWLQRYALDDRQSYPREDLAAAISRLGTHQSSCDRATVLAVVADAAGYRPHTFRLQMTGVILMVLGAFLLGRSSSTPPAPLLA